ncbi:hypothetical protein BsWGS_07390 [Bradybaena similaris]
MLHFLSLFLEKVCMICLACWLQKEKTSTQDLEFEKENIQQSELLQDLKNWLSDVIHEKQRPNTDCCHRDGFQSPEVKCLNNFSSQATTADISSQEIANQASYQVHIAAEECIDDHGAGRDEGHGEILQPTTTCDHVVADSSERLNECDSLYYSQEVGSDAGSRTAQNKKYSLNLERMGSDSTSVIVVPDKPLTLLETVIENEDMKSLCNICPHVGLNMTSVCRTCAHEGQDLTYICPHEGRDMKSVCSTTCPYEGQDTETTCNTACRYEDHNSLVHINKAADLDNTLEAGDQVLLEDSQRDLFESQALSEGGSHTQISLSADIIFNNEKEKIYAADKHSCGSDLLKLNISDQEISSPNRQIHAISQQGISFSNLHIELSGQGSSSACLQSKNISEQLVSSLDLQMKVAGYGNRSSCLQIKEVAEQGTSSSDLQLKDVSGHQGINSSDLQMKVYGQRNSSSCLQIQEVSEQRTAVSFSDLYIKCASEQQGTSSSDLYSKDVSEQQGASSSDLYNKDVSEQQGASTSDLQIKDVSEQQWASFSYLKKDTYHQEINATDMQKNCSPEMFSLGSCSSVGITDPGQSRGFLASVKEELNEAVISAIVADDDRCSTASDSTLPPLQSLQHSPPGKGSVFPCVSLVSERVDMDKMTTEEAEDMNKMTEMTGDLSNIATEIVRVRTLESEPLSQESKASSLLLNCPSLEGSDEPAKMVKMRSRQCSTAAGVRTSRASSRKKRSRSRQALDQLQLPVIDQQQLQKSGLLHTVTDGLRKAQVGSELPMYTIKHIDQPIRPATDLHAPTVAETPDGENRLADRMKLQRTNQPKDYSKELHRLLTLYDKMLDKFSTGHVLDGKGHLQKFEQILHKMKATHESYRARLLSSGVRRGAAWHRQWQHALDNQAMLAVACDKHQQLEQRVRTGHSGSQVHKPDEVSQHGLQIFTSAGLSSCQQSSCSNLQEFNSSAKQCGTTEYGLGKDRSGVVSSLLGVTDCQTVTAKGHKGVNSSSQVEIQKIIGEEPHVEGNSSGQIGTQRTGDSQSCRRIMDPVISHLLCTSTTGRYSLPQILAGQEETHLPCLHEITSLETLQVGSHVSETIPLQAHSHVQKNVLLQAGSYVKQTGSDVSQNVNFSDDSHTSGSAVSVEDDSDIDETVFKAADKVTQKRHSTVEDVMQNDPDGCAVGVHEATVIPQACKKNSAAVCREKSHEGSGRKHLLKQALRMGSVDGLSGKIKIISGQSSETRSGTLLMQDQLLSSRSLTKELTSPVLTTNTSAACIVANGTCLQEWNQQPEAEHLSKCLANVGVSKTADQVHHIHHVMSQSHDCKNPGALATELHQVTKETSGNTDAIEVGGVKPQPSTGRLTVTGATSSACLTNQHLPLPLAGGSLGCGADDALGYADTAIAQDVDANPATRELASNVIVDYRDTATVQNVGAKCEAWTQPAARELTDGPAESRFSYVGYTASAAHEVGQSMTSHVQTGPAETKPAAVSTGKWADVGAPESSDIVVGCTNTSSVAWVFSQSKSGQSQMKLAAAETRDAKHGASQRSDWLVPLVPCTTGSEHRVIPTVPGTSDSEDRIPVVSDTNYSEHRIQVVPGTSGSNNRFFVISDTTDSENRIPVELSTTGCKKTFLEIVDSCKSEVFHAPGSTSLPTEVGQRLSSVHRVVTHLPSAQITQTSKLKAHKSVSGLPSNTTHVHISSEPASPSSTVSSSLFLVSSKEKARRLDRNTSGIDSCKSSSQSTQTGNNNLHYQGSAAAKPRTFSLLSSQSFDAKNLAMMASSGKRVIIDLTSPLHQVTSGLPASSCKPHLEFHSLNPAGGRRRDAVTSDSRKRGRQKKSNTAGKKGKKAKSDYPTSAVHQGQIQQYFPLVRQHIASDSGSVTNSITKHGSVITCESGSQPHIPVNHNTGIGLDNNKGAPKPYTETNKLAEFSTSKEFSRKFTKGVDVPLLIRNLRRVLLIADEEVTGTSSDFPPDFWEEDFTNIRMSESFWKTLDDW